MELRARQHATLHEGEDRRKHPRFQVLWWAQIEVGSDLLACVVSDLSVGGAKVHTRRAGPVGTQVKLAMPPFGDFEAVIMWSRDGRIGVRFADADHDRMAKVIASGLNRMPQ